MQCSIGGIDVRPAHQVVLLFSGAGGSSREFASAGIRSRYEVDIDRRACDIHEQERCAVPPDSTDGTRRNPGWTRQLRRNGSSSSPHWLHGVSANTATTSPTERAGVPTGGHSPILRRPVKPDHAFALILPEDKTARTMRGRRYSATSVASLSRLPSAPNIP